MTGLQGKAAPPLQAADLAPLHASMPDGYPAQLQELAYFIYASLITQDTAKGTLEQWAFCAVNAVNTLAFELGGGYLYIANMKAFQQRQKYSAIKREFKGNNVRELAKKYGLTEIRIRQIVKQRAPA